MKIKDLQVIIAWLAGKISEGSAARMIGVNRLRLRTMRDDAIEVATTCEHCDTSIDSPNFAYHVCVGRKRLNQGGDG